MEAGPFTIETEQGRMILDDDAISLEEHQLAILEAPSGRGKSTLLRCVAGVIGGAGSNRRLAGTRFSGRTIPQWRSRVVLMAQDAPMLPGTIEANLVFPYRFGAAGERVYDRGRAMEEMQHLDLDHLEATTDVSRLSGGERHRLALVRALLWDPPVILADEPLSGLDPERSQAALDRLAAFAHRPGHGAVIVQHGHDAQLRSDRRMTMRPLVDR